MISIELCASPTDPDFISSYKDTAEAVFGDEADQGWIESLDWRIINMPDISVFVAKNGSDIVGFKAGYAITEWNYCSWLGGVVPSYRRQGIAWQLLEEQHNWLKGQRFKLIETHVEESNQPMIDLNLKGGFKTVGSFMKWDKPFFIMHKMVNG